MANKKADAIINKLKKEGFIISDVKTEKNKTFFKVNGHSFHYCDAWTSSAAEFVRYIKNALKTAENKQAWRF